MSTGIEVEVVPPDLARVCCSAVDVTEILYRPGPREVLN